MSHYTSLDIGSETEIISGSSLVNGAEVNIVEGVVTIPEYNEPTTISFNKKPISMYSPGSILKITEDSVTTEFYLAEHNYESDLNGLGRTLLVRKYLVPQGLDGSQIIWSDTNGGYTNSFLDCWLNSLNTSHDYNFIDKKGYLSRFSENMRNAISTTVFRFGLESIPNLERPIFALSDDELTNLLDGELIRAKALESSTSWLDHWTRDIGSNGTAHYAYYVSSSNSGISSKLKAYSYTSVRPAFTLPSNMLVDTTSLEIIE